jgi:hypothetical protein
VTLASSGAVTLMTLMVGDGWAQVKEGFATLLGRRGDKAAMATELEASREQLLAAQASSDVQAEADVQAEWRARLRRLLEQDPEAAPLLAELVERYSSAVGQASAHTEIHHNVFLGPTATNTGNGPQTNTFGGTER